MRRFKSLIFLAVIAMMVFGLVTTANAKVFTDSKGTDSVTAVDALSQLGIVTGYPDGTIKPDQTITRAEFAAIVVREMGLSSDIAPSATNFSDVDDTHWASGLINVAVGQGLLKGYPDGTFQPDANVTYAEAITILVRMLGYGPSIDESKWPAPYLATGSRIGVTDSVKVKINEAATRGDVFTMAFNSLDADVMKQQSWGTDNDYVESKDFKDTILNDKLDVYRVGDEDDPVRVTDTPLVNTSLDSDTFIVGSNDDRNSNDHPYGSKFGSYDLTNGLVPNDYLGQEVELWVDDSAEKVLFIRVQTSSNDIVSDVVDDYDIVTVNGKDYVKNFKMLSSGKTYSISKNVIAYMNTRNKAEDTDTSSDTYNRIPVDNVRTGGTVPDFFGRAVKLILDDNGDVAWVESFKGNSWVASEDADVEDEEIKGYMNSDSEYTLDLSDNDRYIVLKDGAPATLADIKKDDCFVVYPNPTIAADNADEDDIRLIKVFSTKVTGTLDNVYSNGGAVDDYVVTVDGKDYPVIGNMFESDYWIHAISTFTTDNNETIDEITEEDFDDLLGQNVTLDIVGGSVRHIQSDADVSGSSDIYAVLNTLEYDSFDGLRAKVTNKNGDDVTYQLNDDTEFYTAEMKNMALNINSNLKSGSWTEGGDIDDEDNWDASKDITGAYLVKIDLNGSGEIDELHFLADVHKGALGLEQIKIDENDYRIRIANKGSFSQTEGSYAVENWASLYDALSGNADDTSWSALQDTQDNAAGNLDGFAYVDDDNVVAVVITGGVLSVKSDMMTGVVMNRTKINNAYKFSIMLNGEVKEYNTDGENIANQSYTGDNEGTMDGSAKASSINKGDVVVYQTNSQGEIDDIWELTSGGSTNAKTVADNVYEKAGQRWLVVDKNDSSNILTLAPMDANGKEMANHRFTIDLSNSDDADEASYLFDYTESTPKVIEIGNVSTGDEVMIFYFADGSIASLDRSGGDADKEMVQLVKVVD